MDARALLFALLAVRQAGGGELCAQVGEAVGCVLPFRASEVTALALGRRAAGALIFFALQMPKRAGLMSLLPSQQIQWRNTHPHLMGACELRSSRWKLLSGPHDAPTLGLQALPYCSIYSSSDAGPGYQRVPSINRRQRWGIHQMTIHRFLTKMDSKEGTRIHLLMMCSMNHSPNAILTRTTPGAEMLAIKTQPKRLSAFLDSAQPFVQADESLLGDL